jgi:peptidoglycan/LPS O-acetylase OafA/YrhL
MPAFLTGPGWLRRALSSRLLVYIGTRSYGLYLVHRLAKGVIDRLVAPNGSLPEQIMRFVLITALGLLGAELLRRTIEQPMIALGRRLTSRMRQEPRTSSTPVTSNEPGRTTSWPVAPTSRPLTADPTTPLRNPPGAAVGGS